MHLFHEHLLSHLNIPYIWGGNNPLVGFDCSGLACWMLKSHGVIGSDKDYSAQGLYELLEKDGSFNMWKIGAMAFFGKSATKVSHVGILLDQYRMVEAGGGDSRCKTKEDAAARDACVRIRPIRYRKDLVAVIKPRYASIGVI